MSDPQVPDRSDDDTRSVGRPTAEPAPLVPGQLVAGRYRIVRLAGSGGMGEVYLAFDLKLDQPVALKGLPRTLADDERMLARLLDEVRLARQIAHPNVCRVHDVVEDAGRHFITMEFIDGRNLAELLAERCPARDEALGIARQLCAGLSAAHDRGIVHRDLKPSNVMVDARGVVRITDFGLARPAASPSAAPGQEGTPRYMAPEVLAGNEADLASDLYSLGLLLYELFTGRAAREGRTVDELTRASLVPPRAPSRLVADIDPRIDRAVLPCLELEPSRRPASARVVAAALPGGELGGRASAAAQQRADRIAAFRVELAELRRQGVLALDAETLGAVERHHARVLRELVDGFDVDVTERGRFLSLGMRAFSTLGALALAASLFYFFYQIWGRITTGSQLAILLGTPVALLVAVDRIAARERQRYFTSTAALVAWACFVTATSLSAATFNLPVGSPVLAAWAALGLLLAYAYSVALALVVGLALAAACPVAFLLDALGLEWASGILGRPEGLLAAGLVLFFLADWLRHERQPVFGAIYRSVGMFVTFFPVFLLVTHAAGSCLHLRAETTQTLYQAGGLLGAVGAVGLGVARRRAHVVHGGALAFTALLLAAMVDWFWDWMPRYLFFFIVSAAALAILAVLRRLHAGLSRAVRVGA